MKLYVRRGSLRAIITTTFHALCVCVVLQQTLRAQVISVRSAGLAGIQAALPADPWAVFQNPAASVQARAVATSLHRSYGLSELDEPAVSVTLPVFGGRTSFGVSSVGWSRFRLWRGMAGGAWQTGGLAVGASVESQRLVLPSPYRNDYSFSLHTGLQWFLDEDLMMGAVVRNALSTGWQVGGSTLGRELRTGVAWQPEEVLLLAAELWMNGRQEADLMGGVEWAPLPQVMLRTGAGTEPLRWSLGFGVSGRGWASQVAASRHHVSALGWTTGIELRRTW